ncbi:MAG: DUF4404 family protein [bacterium]
MSQKTLRKQLEELKTEIDVLEKKHAGARDRLDNLVSAIEHQLENTDDEAHRQSLSGDIRKYIDDFETYHPDVIGVLDKISVTLSNMGI